MARPPPLLIHRLALLLALSVSAALWLDYRHAVPSFCAIGSGCDQVRSSPFSRILGVPLPLLGLSGAGGLLLMSLARSGAQRRAHRFAAMGGGLLAVALVLVQALAVHAFCKLCLVADAALCTAAVTAWLSQAPDVPPLWLWPSAAVVVVALPFAFRWAGPPAVPVPAEVESLWEKGKINVVEFADFECPFCRKLHPLLREVMEPYGQQVHLVRLNMPLAMHPQAKDAARAYCCADAQGKGEKMADLLFETEDLTPEGCRKLAARLGLSLASYETCVSQEADTRIDRESARVRASGLRGLPTVWVGEELLVGTQPVETLREAFERAAQGRSPFGLSAGWMWGVVALVGGLTAFLARRSPAAPS